MTASLCVALSAAATLVGSPESPPAQFPATLAEARSGLALVVHSRFAVDLARVTAEAEGQTPIRLAGEAVGALFVGAEWQGDTDIPITEDVLLAWAVPWNAVRRAAVARLKAHSYERALVGQLFTEIDDRVYSNPPADPWGPSLLLYPKRIKRLFRGDPVVVVPTPTTILIAPADDPTALAAMADHVVRLIYQGPTLSVRPLRLRRGRWQPFAVEPRHPAHDAFRHLMLTELDAQYELSRPLLQSLAARWGEPVAVSKLHLIEDGAGTLIAVTTLTRGTRTLLPRADVVALIEVDEGDVDEGKVDGEGERARVLAWAAWDELATMLGSSMIQREGEPEWWDVKGFPTPAQLARLARLARHRTLELEEIPR